MALPDLQKLPKIEIRKQASTRFQGAVAPEIDPSFLNVASNAMEIKRKREEKLRAEQLDFVKTTEDNNAENDVILANAELAQVDGLNASDKMIQLRDKLMKKYEKRKENIPEQFVPYVEQIYQKKLTRFNKFAIPYTLGQVKKVHDEANKTYLANSMNEAIESSGDFEEFNRDALARVTYAAGKAASRKFGNDPELIKDAVSRSVSETIRRSVEQQAFIGRFDKAEGLIEEFNEELTPADRVKALKLIQNARSEMGDNLASDLVRLARAEVGDEDPAQVFAYIRGASKNDKVRTKAEFLYRSELNAEKTAKEFQIERITAKINQAVAQKQNPAELIRQLPPGEERDKVIERLNKNRGQENVLTDWTAHDRLTKRLTSALSARELPDDLIDSYRHLISPKDMKPLEDRFGRLKETDNKEALRVNRLAYTMADEELEAFAKQNRVRGQDRGMLQGAVYDEVDRMLTLGGKLDTQQFRSKIRNTLRTNGIKEKVTERTVLGIPYWFDKKERTVQPDLSPDSTPTPHSSWVEAIRQARPHYTPAQVNAAVQELIKAQVDVTKPRY